MSNCQTQDQSSLKYRNANSSWLWRTEILSIYQSVCLSSFKEYIYIVYYLYSVYWFVYMQINGVIVIVSSLSKGSRGVAADAFDIHFLFCSS